MVNRYGLDEKDEAVDLASSELSRQPMTLKQPLAMRGAHAILDSPAGGAPRNPVDPQLGLSDEEADLKGESRLHVLRAARHRRGMTVMIEHSIGAPDRSIRPSAVSNPVSCRSAAAT